MVRSGPEAVCRRPCAGIVGEVVTGIGIDFKAGVVAAGNLQPDPVTGVKNNAK